MSVPCFVELTCISLQGIPTVSDILQQTHAVYQGGTLWFLCPQAVVR
jgi:hypothetical protein